MKLPNDATKKQRKIYDKNMDLYRKAKSKFNKEKYGFVMSILRASDLELAQEQLYYTLDMNKFINTYPYSNKWYQNINQL